ncbi:hypothetical protein BN946_scf185043.g247 [Trametes cinnabarina]|uniref:Glycosyltransferase Family 1 protein n=1 Tax=Pycnoporus cinnabarinus TaxID=5643 RepID=A0A060SIG6_PYCCI|nr:hypothetical protein BN946_scf185043.g247 [Trametes cinnabarina]
MGNMPSHRTTSLGLLTALVVGVFWLLSRWLDPGTEATSSSWSRTTGGYPPYLNVHGSATPASTPDRFPRRRRNVAFATSFVLHGDVYMAFAKSVGDVMDAEGGDDQRIDLFAPEFSFGFQGVVDDLNLWTHRGIRAGTDQLIEHVNKSSEDGGIQLIVLGTCEFDMNHYQSALVDAWGSRRDDDKFKIACVVHNVDDLRWQRHIPFWARRNAIRLLPIADHVAKGFRERFAVQADSLEPLLYTVGLEHIPVDVHVPILDIPHLPVRPLPRALEKAVIQGTFAAERRNYAGIFRGLIASLHEDPKAWGYRPLDGRPSFVPDPDSPIPPFRLLLVGSGWLDVPEELSHVVSMHTNLPYHDFYELIADCDIVVPAFADNTYLSVQASSTIALATELQVPLLVTNRTRRAYRYIDDPRAVVTRPAAMPEVQALKALRTGDASSFLSSDPADIGQAIGALVPLREAVDDMMHEGWIRETRSWKDWKEEVWKRNREVAERILRDRP